MNNKASSEELIAFCHILTTSLKSGRPLPVSLMSFPAGRENSQAVDWCRKIGKRLAEGYSLEQSVKDLAGFDPVLARLMPLFGENRLLKILESYTRYLVIIESLNQKLSSAIFYPFMVLLLSVLNLFHLNFFLFPCVMKDLVESGRGPSLLMKVLFFADWHFWPGSLVIPLILLASIFFMARNFIVGLNSGATFWGWISGLNGIVYRQNAARAQAAVALYLDAGMSLEKSLRMASEIFDESAGFGLADVAAAIEHGMTIQDSFAQSPALRDVCVTKDTAEELDSVLSRFSRGNYSASLAMLERLSNISGTFALLLAGFLVLCVTSGFFNTYFWVIWSY